MMDIEEFDVVDIDMLARALLYCAASGDFTKEEGKILLELRERVRLPYSYERATRVLAESRSIMDLTRPARPEDMDTTDGCGR